MTEVSWRQARALAASAVDPLPPVAVPLDRAGGAVLAENACAATDLPPLDVSAMDGWAVAEPAPDGAWQVIDSVLAGAMTPRPLCGGEAVGIATGASLPGGTAGVLRREDGTTIGDRLVSGIGPVAPGAHARSAATECRRGDVVLEAGSTISAVGLGLLAAAGLDRVLVRRVRADLLVLGDELLHHGPARDGRIRDALGPLLSAWLPGRGVQVFSRQLVPDTAPALRAALAACLGDVVITTGSTARGPVDHLHEVLAGLGAELLVDGVAVRPGHPQLLALLPDRRPVVGLPGNPLAAVSALLTLFDPVLAALRGLPVSPAELVELLEDVDAGPAATRLLPVRNGRPVLHAGPAMLRGLATADGIAVVPPGGAHRGERVELLRVT